MNKNNVGFFFGWMQKPCLKIGLKGRIVGGGEERERVGGNLRERVEKEGEGGASYQNLFIEPVAKN